MKLSEGDVGVLALVLQYVGHTPGWRNLLFNILVFIILTFNKVSYCKEDSLSFKFLRSTLGEYCFQRSSTAGICCYDSLSKSGGSLIISNIRDLLGKGELGIDSRKREALSPFGG